MAISIQTNTTSLVSQENLRVNGNFQSRTITRLTSGYRINSSADDAAGLAIANKFRSDTAELTQGVRNANDGVSQLQIIDGGLSNISNILDRMKTLATEAASSTFTGDRATLQAEYSDLREEINRQAANIGLGTGTEEAAAFLKQIGVYIGGGAGQSNASVDLDLSSSAVDALSLGLNSDLDDSVAATTLVTGDFDGSTKYLSYGASQTFTFSTAEGDTTVTVAGTTSGISGAEIVSQMNEQLIDGGVTGITVSVDDSGNLVATSDSTAFAVTATAATDTTSQITEAITTPIENTAMYRVSAGDLSTGTSTLTFLAGDGTTSLASFTLDGDVSLDDLNTALEGSGITALSVGGNIYFQSESTFSAGTSDDVGNLLSAAATTATQPSTQTDATAAAQTALLELEAAVSALGAVQGTVGAAENTLAYAISLAQSQITNYSSAESQIRDSDVASEAANLTKAQVLQQASIAAMAQANSAPQAVLSLLKG